MEDKIRRLPLLSRAQVIRISRLLYMKYRPSEIAELLEVNVDTVYRSYLPNGCPHERDSQGHIWIIGTAFTEWAKDVIAKKKRKKTHPMADDEAWCVKCNARVKVIKPIIKPVNRFLELIQSKCPNCGITVNRAQRASRENGTD